MIRRQTLLSFALALSVAAAPALAEDKASVKPVGTSFSEAEILAGFPADPARCASYGTAVWVVVENKPECVRYFLAGETSQDRDALVFLNGDIVDYDREKRAFDASIYARQNLTVETMQAIADRMALGAKRPALYLARPGTFGSSGQESRIRHTVREAKIISAALDAIKARHGFRGFHVAGQSGGGGMTAAMVNMRTDVACAVIASGDAAMFETFRDENSPIPTGDYARSIYDASQHVNEAKRSDKLRVFVLTDPQDQVVSARAQTVYVQAAQSAGLPVKQIFAFGWGDKHHGLSRQATWALEDCALQFPDTHLERGVAEISKKLSAMASADPKPR